MSVDRDTIEAIAGKAASQATVYAINAGKLATRGRALMAELEFAKCDALNEFSMELQRIADNMPGGAFKRSEQ